MAHIIHYRIIIGALLFVLFKGCANQAEDTMPVAPAPIAGLDTTRTEGLFIPGNPRRFLALGDSYTIGSGVPEQDRWPVQLAARLRDAGVPMSTPQIIAGTGWTTTRLISFIEAGNPSGPYDLVSLLIGVNNQFQGLDPLVFQREFAVLLQKCISYSGDANRVIVLSIPDYGATPAGAPYSFKIGPEIDQYNTVVSGICLDYGVKYFNITEISRKAQSDASLFAFDGLHPSGKLYARWVEAVFPEVLKLLK
jgi:acyl-CoA thioesterase I